MSRPADKTAEARKKNELTTGTDRGRLAAAATGPVCRATRYSRQRDVLVVVHQRQGEDEAEDDDTTASSATSSAAGPQQAPPQV